MLILGREGMPDTIEAARDLAERGRLGERGAYAAAEMLLQGLIAKSSGSARRQLR